MCRVCFFNMTYQLVGLGMVVDVDEHDLQDSGISDTIPNRFLLKKWIKTCHVCFLKYDLPT